MKQKIRHSLLKLESMPLMYMMHFLKMTKNFWNMKPVSMPQKLTQENHMYVIHQIIGVFKMVHLVPPPTPTAIIDRINRQHQIDLI